MQHMNRVSREKKWKYLWKRIELNGKEVQTGHTKEYMKIALETNENLKNSIVKVQIGKDSQIIH